MYKFTTNRDSSHMASSEVEGDIGDLVLHDKVELKELGALIESYYQSDTYRTTRHLDWLRNIYFYHGKHHIRPIQGTTWEVIPKNDRNKRLPRPTINQIRVECNTLINVLTANAPHMDVAPNSRETSDEFAAKLSRIILDSKEFEDDEEELREELATWNVLTGNAFRKDYWNPDAGAIIDGQFTGDTAVDVVPPFCITVNPQATNRRDLEWIMEHRPRTLSWIRENYGRSEGGFTNMAEKVKADGQTNDAVQALLSCQSLGDYPNRISYSTDENSLKNSAIVKEWYARPTKKFPKGRMVVVASGIVLYQKNVNPYADATAKKWHPYSHSKYDLISYSFWGSTPMSGGVDVQRKINTTQALVELNYKTLAVNRIIAPYNAGIKKGTFTGRPGGGLIKYKWNPESSTGGKPEILEGRGLPAEVRYEKADLRSELSRVMGVHEVLKGDKISGIKTYSSLELLREEANKNLHGSVRRFERMIESGGKQKLVLTQRFMKASRPDYAKHLLTLSKDADAIMIKEFKGADLKGNHTVRVRSGSIAPRSQAAKRAGIIEAGQYGILNFDSPLSQVRAAAALGLEIEHDLGPHLQKSRYENEHLRNGKVAVTGDDFDDHEVHLQEHFKLLFNPNFNELDGPTQKNIKDHINFHNDILQQAQQQAREMEIQAMQQIKMIEAEAKIAEKQPAVEVEIMRVQVEAQRVEIEKLKVLANNKIKENELDLKAQEMLKNPGGKENDRSSS